MYVYAQAKVHNAHLCMCIYIHIVQAKAHTYAAHIQSQASGKDLR